MKTTAGRCSFSPRAKLPWIERSKKLSCAQLNQVARPTVVSFEALEFGAFVECLPGKEGLVHISELADFRVNKTEDICKLGDEMVKCIGMDKGKVKLSRKAALEQSEDADSDLLQLRQKRSKLQTQSCADKTSTYFSSDCSAVAFFLLRFGNAALARLNKGN